jgi:hypothetical protein
MKHILLLLIFYCFCLSVNAQRDTISFSAGFAHKAGVIESAGANINIYPVPVRENTFTIKSDREISAIKITNIIGQEVYTIKYTTPQSISRIMLDNPRRGMYLVAIIFNDNTRIVKKIMVEEFN